jgi:hypothetical protein
MTRNPEESDGPDQVLKLLDASTEPSRTLDLREESPGDFKDVSTGNLESGMSKPDNDAHAPGLVSRPKLIIPVFSAHHKEVR